MNILLKSVMAAATRGHEEVSRVREAFDRDHLPRRFEMKKMNYRLVAILLAFPLALSAVACGEKEGLTAENVTLEECNDLFPEEETADASEAEEDEMLEGDYDADGDEDKDDEAIKERCEELMAEDDEAEEEIAE
jgi:hypothetical protein